tara:strand:+ start:181 stop:540 length:360 start_codon:yes stop_codon:yes gene_type:complete
MGDATNDEWTLTATESQLFLDGKTVLRIDPRIPLGVFKLHQHIDELTKQLAQHEEVALILRGFQQAYPLDIFPEIEDWKGVNYFMEQAGLSLSRVSASNMRHVVKCITEALPQQNDTRS